MDPLRKIEQKTLLIDCMDGQPAAVRLDRALGEGWRVVIATPILDTTSRANGLASFTTAIFYILERERTLA